MTLRIEKPIPEQTVFVEHVLPLWLGPLNPFQDQVLTQLQERLEGPLEVPLHIACIHGRKARPSPA